MGNSSHFFVQLIVDIMLAFGYSGSHTDMDKSLGQGGDKARCNHQGRTSGVGIRQSAYSANGQLYHITFDENKLVISAGIGGGLRRCDSLAKKSSSLSGLTVEYSMWGKCLWLVRRVRLS
jgi:hypothetical protein